MRTRKLGNDMITDKRKLAISFGLCFISLLLALRKPYIGNNTDEQQQLIIDKLFSLFLIF